MGVRAIRGDAGGVEHRTVVTKTSRLWSECSHLARIKFAGALRIEERRLRPQNGRREYAQQADYEEDA